MALADLAATTLDDALSPAASTILVKAGTGTYFNDAGGRFFATITPAGELPNRGNSEIVEVISRVNDSFVVNRAQKGTTAKTFNPDDVIVAGIYADVLGRNFMDVQPLEAGIVYAPTTKWSVVELETYGKGQGSANSAVIATADNYDMTANRIDHNTGSAWYQISSMILPPGRYMKIGLQPNCQLIRATMYLMGG